MGFGPWENHPPPSVPPSRRGLCRLCLIPHPPPAGHQDTLISFKMGKGSERGKSLNTSPPTPTNPSGGRRNNGTHIGRRATLAVKCYGTTTWEAMLLAPPAIYQSDYPHTLANKFVVVKLIKPPATGHFCRREKNAQAFQK